ncbi:thiamine phosphate synthase [Propionivibrio limicola]|uniref:thiamine phosphate synthase n=1 Tax=Propionivibrio limicola TaxID=167645 RepID=UPI001292BA8C|nr:thiamine phosphate synthase [Propionivibrio limicola]
MTLNPIDLSLYLVLDPDLCGSPGEMVRTARLAAENGATVVQLRAPGWKKRLWLETAVALKSALAPLGVPLIINDHVDIALAVDADGVHIGQGDLPVEETRRLLGPNKILGLSVSTAAELAAVPSGVDYLGIGPVYPTGTKPDAAPATGLPLFAELVAATILPVVAIGGIKRDNCSPLLVAGAGGVAVVSAICGQNDAAWATAALREMIESACSLS